MSFYSLINSTCSAHSCSILQAHPSPNGEAKHSYSNRYHTSYKKALCYSFFELIWPLPFCHLTLSLLYSLYLHLRPCISCHTPYTSMCILSRVYHTTCTLWCLPYTVYRVLTTASRTPVTGQPTSRPSGQPSSRPTQTPTNLVYQKIAVNLFQVHMLSMIFCVSVYFLQFI